MAAKTARRPGNPRRPFMAPARRRPSPKLTKLEAENTKLRTSLRTSRTARRDEMQVLESEVEDTRVAASRAGAIVMGVSMAVGLGVAEAIGDNKITIWGREFDTRTIVAIAITATAVLLLMVTGGRARWVSLALVGTAAGILTHRVVDGVVGSLMARGDDTDDGIPDGMAMMIDSEGRPLRDTDGGLVLVPIDEVEEYLQGAA